MLGDGKFKLEIGMCDDVKFFPYPSRLPTAYRPPADITTGLEAVKTAAPTLSLFVTSVMLEYAHTDYEICTSMFAGIKCQHDLAGERGSRPDWTWKFWQGDWIFREDSEVWGKCLF